MAKKCKKGFKPKKGKCVRVKKKMRASGSYKRNRKSYNPFKMWGSWVGIFIGIIYKLSSIITTIGDIPSSRISYSLLGLWRFNTFGLFAQFITTAILGFLIGWGIHSLVRKVRK